MKRKPGSLLPIELDLLRAALELRAEGELQFHGYLIASKMRERDGARMLTAHGTLYKALDRLRRGGLLESAWEDPLTAAAQDRPRRRLYTVTAAGERALREAERDAASGAFTMRERLEPL